MTVDVASLVSKNLDVWTTSIEPKSGVGRRGGKRVRPHGIDRLRALILDLAVRGKLVLQDPNDEPASQLMERIKKEKAQRIRAGKMRKPREQDGGGHDMDVPFPIPETWRWVRLDEVGEIVGGGTPPAGNARNFADGGQGIPWITPADLGRYKERYIAHGERDLSDAGLKASSATVMPAGSVLFTSRAPIGYVAIAANPVSTNQGFKSIVPYVSQCSLYIALAMKSFAKAINDSAPGTTFKEVSAKMVAALSFPLPPLAEQQRIVAKADELMALCDSLEVESAAAMAAHQTLVEALLATLTASSAADLSSSWMRLEAHFDTLFTTESSIDMLKEAILELAVRGKLVPQDPGDEPASVMLAAVKKCGSDRGSKHKSHATIANADHPFDLPDGWCWERFDNLIDSEFPIAYGVLVPGADQPDGVPFVRIGDLSISDPSPLPEKAISPAVDAQFARTRLRGGEILMGVVGSVGKLGVAPDGWAGANIARAICRIVPSPLLDKDYILWLLQSRFMQDSFLGDTRTLAQPTLNIGLIRLAATPVPPFAEQRRIVAKLRELMALCDGLRTSIGDVSATQIKLADTVVERATR